MKTYSELSLTELELRIMEDLIKADPECRRGKKITEIHPVLMQLKCPDRRVFMSPFRYNNVFALIAETLWVLGGRDDMEFLSYYLPRARDWSDDGAVWKAAYGPRLRRWFGLNGRSAIGSTVRQVDQLCMMLAELKKDLHTRRAVAVIHDPVKDDSDTQDRPCNNWLHFMHSNGKLDMEITSRSTDFLWGSNVNLFEWSVLHEIMAYWTKQKMGSLYFYTSSCHLYVEFLDRVKKIVNYQSPIDIYDSVKPIAFDVSRDPAETYEMIDVLFDFEAGVRGDRGYSPRADMQMGRIDDFGSEWLSAWARMLRAYCLMEQKQFLPASRVLGEIPKSDIQLAGFEVLQRRWLKSGKKYAPLFRKHVISALGAEMYDYLEEFKSDENS